MRVCFRCDGGEEIGWGHLMRCVALAEILMGDFDIYFYVRQGAEDVMQLTNNKAFNINELASGEMYSIEEAMELGNALEEGDIVVFDGYHFSAEYLRTVNHGGCKIVYIDDLIKDDLPADVVINHAGSLSSEEFNLASDVKLCLGPKFVMIRNEFLSRVGRSNDGDTGTILICLGNSNLGKECLIPVLKGVLADERSKKVRIVANLTKEEVSQELKLGQSVDADQVIEVFRNQTAGQMADLIESSGVAIVPSSTISYEVCSTRTALIIGHFTENQERIYKGLVQAGCAYGVGHLRQLTHEKLSQALSYVWHCDNANNMLSAQQRFIDGTSPSNIKSIFHSLC